MSYNDWETLTNYGIMVYTVYIKYIKRRSC